MHSGAVSRRFAEAKPIRVPKLAVSAGLVLLLFLVLAGTAMGHQTQTVLLNDGSYALMRSDHMVIFGCDKDVDGHKAYLRQVDVWGSVYPPVYDPDGAEGAGCALADPYAWYLGSYTICVQYEGCGPPVKSTAWAYY